jgi:hypothetical protein
LPDLRAKYVFIIGIRLSFILYLETHAWRDVLFGGTGWFMFRQDGLLHLYSMPLSEAYRAGRDGSEVEPVLPEMSELLVADRVPVPAVLLTSEAGRVVP